jgi:hypothetical protein
MKKLKYVKLFEQFKINESDSHVGEICYRGVVTNSNISGFGNLHDSKEINKRLEDFFECDLISLSKKVRQIGNIVILYWKDNKEAINRPTGPEVGDIETISIGLMGKGIVLKKGYSLEEFKNTFCK